MKKQETTPKTREQLFAEKASKSYAICHSQSCSMRSSCLRWQLRDYTPKDRRINACVNLNNPATYASVAFTPDSDGFITISKDNAGTANLKTYVFCAADLVRGNE